MQDTTRLLQQQVQQLRRVIELKDSEIADLKRQLELFNHRNSSPIDPMASPQAQHAQQNIFERTPSYSIPNRSERRSASHEHSSSTVSTTSSNYSLTSPKKKQPQLNNDPIHDSKTPLQLTLSNQSDSEFVTLGSSPRKPTPVRLKFTEEELSLENKNDYNNNNNTTIESIIESNPDNTLVFINDSDKDHMIQPQLQVNQDLFEVNTLQKSLEDTPIDVNRDSTNSKTYEDFNFDKAVTPNLLQPVYQKLSNTSNETVDSKSSITQRMMMSRTPSENIDMGKFHNQPTVNPRLSVNDEHIQIDDLPARPLTPPLLTNSNPKQKKQQHSNLINNFNSPSIPADDQVFELAEPIILKSSKNQPPVQLQRIPIPAHEPTVVSSSTPQLGSTSATFQKSAQATPTQSQTDSHKFLINSLEHTVIKVETVVDPVAINDPKIDSYWILFKVFSNENPQQLTPMYRIKRNYNDFLIMDKIMRPTMPFLQQPPDISSLKRQNYRLWEQNKLVIDGYVDQALAYLKRGMPNTEPALKSFTTYFEFTLPSFDENNVDTDDPSSLSFLDLTTHWDYLLYVKQKFPNKTFDVIRLIFNDDSNILTLQSFSSKSEQIFRDDTIVSFRGQEIVLKKKKKFAANKVWILYAQSHQDGASIGNRLKDWLETDSSYNDGFENEDDDFDDNHTFDSHSQSSLTLPSQTTPTMTTVPPSGASPSLSWSLFGKRTSKMPPTSPKSSNSIPSPNKVDNVLTFKSQPYEGKMTTSTSSITSITSPKKKLGITPTFEPIDNAPKYFGTTLQGAFDLCPKYQLGRHNVPSVIFRCLNYLHNNSAEGFEGIFRLNGMMSEVNAIEREFNSNYDCALEEMATKPDVYSVATLMKRYLRKVEGGIIIDDIAEEIYHIIKNDDNGDLSISELDQIKKLIRALPVMNRDVLFVVFKYIMDVLTQGAHNKMGVNAMSVLIGPNIAESRGMPIAVVLMKHFNHVFDFK